MANECALHISITQEALCSIRGGLLDHSLTKNDLLGNLQRAQHNFIEATTECDSLNDDIYAGPVLTELAKLGQCINLRDLSDNVNRRICAKQVPIELISRILGSII